MKAGPSMGSLEINDHWEKDSLVDKKYLDVKTLLILIAWKYFNMYGFCNGTNNEQIRFMLCSKD